MLPLRGNSWRPQVVVDAWAFRLFDPVSRTYVGIAGPFGRERVVSAVPLNGGPQQILPPVAINDAWGFALAAPDGTIVGTPGVTISRILSAMRTADTRRL